MMCLGGCFLGSKFFGSLWASRTSWKSISFARLGKLSHCTCYIVMGGALGLRQGRATHMAVLCCYMWGRGPIGNNATCSALGWFSVTSNTHKQIGPFWCWFLGRWVCLRSRALWVSPMNCPVRLGVSPTASVPTDIFTQRFWGFIFPHWNPGFHGVPRSPVDPLVYPHTNVGPPASPAAVLPGPPATILPTLVLQLPPCCEFSPLQLPISAPPTGLHECFFFNSLVLELPYSSVFWQFW